MAAVFGNPLPPSFHRSDPLRRLAAMVHQLRAVQKTGGSGYKTPATGEKAAILEKQVDAALARILGLSA